MSSGQPYPPHLELPPDRTFDIWDFVIGDFTCREHGQVNDIGRDLQRRYSFDVDPLSAHHLANRLWAELNLRSDQTGLTSPPARLHTAAASPANFVLEVTSGDSCVIAQSGDSGLAMRGGDEVAPVAIAGTIAENFNDPDVDSFRGGHRRFTLSGRWCSDVRGRST